MTRPERDEAQRADTRLNIVALFAAIVITVCFAALLGRVAQLQISPSPRLVSHIDARVSAQSGFAARGDIVDRRGRLLATTRLGWRLVVDPAAFEKPYNESFLTLATAAGLDTATAGERLFDRLAENERRAAVGDKPIRYVRLSGVLDDAQADAVRTLRMRGVHLEPASVREGPAERLGGAIVGRVDAEGDGGQFGAERLFNPGLGGEAGRLRYVRDAWGRGLWIERGGFTPAEDGQPVRLSIDLELQKIAEEELDRAVRDADAQGGRLVLLDPSTGEVLALVDQIREDMRDRLLPWGEKPPPDARVRRTIIQPDPARAVHPGAGRHRCFTDLYEPGSTFKAFTWAVMTHAGVAKPDEVFKTGGKSWRTPYGRAITDSFGKAEQTWREVLINSSNIGMSMAAERIDKRVFRASLEKFRIEEVTGLGFAGEQAGHMTSLRDWGRYTQSSVSFGQEVVVTPASLARAFCAFAGDGARAGTVPELTLLAANEPAARHLLAQPAIAPHIARQTREALAEVASRADRNMKQRELTDITFDYRMFGKSGTAQVAIPGERGYVPDQYISSFVAGAPLENPRLVCLVLIDDPCPELVRKRQHFGSWVAGPPVRRVLERSLRYLGVPPDAQQDAPREDAPRPPLAAVAG